MGRIVHALVQQQGLHHMGCYIIPGRFSSLQCSRRIVLCTTCSSSVACSPLLLLLLLLCGQA
jgi:hypothetical protein